MSSKDEPKPPSNKETSSDEIMKICHKCSLILSKKRKQKDDPEDTATGCVVCLGLLSRTADVCKDIIERTSSKLKSYPSLDVMNKNDMEIQLGLPGSMILRASGAIYYGFEKQKRSISEKEIKEMAEDYIANLKYDLKTYIRSCLAEERKSSPPTDDTPDAKDIEQIYANIINVAITLKTNEENDEIKRLSDKSKKEASVMLPLSQSLLKPSATTVKVANISISRQPIYLMGNYTKLARNISQTPFFVNGVTRDDIAASVSECIISPLTKLFCTSNINFHASGREDINVRMLGEGRPFCLHIVDSRVSYLPSVSLIESKLDAEAAVRVAPDSIFYTEASTYSRLQSETEGKTKLYKCVCYSSTPHSRQQLRSLLAEPSFPIELQQRTPIRVLHRRSSTAPRTKFIIGMTAEFINAHYFALEVETSAGTYVKEFVHGDLGRTVPSVGSLLGGRVDILQLDCLEISKKISE